MKEIDIFYVIGAYHNVASVICFDIVAWKVCTVMYKIYSIVW
jgi:hypothetical protein